jgi:hypothetical protein
MKELRASMEVIRKEANSMITEMDGHLADIRMEREQDKQLTEEPIQPEAELVYQVETKYFAIQQVEGGYDYTFYDENFKELDGGVYDNPDIPIAEAMKEILEGEGLTPEDCTAVHYEEFMEQVEEQEQKAIQELQNGNGLNGLSRAEIEETVLAYAQSELEAMGLEQDVQLLGASVYGSRSREGLSTPDSDIDVVLSYSGDISEDSFFNALHEHGMKIGGMVLDVNPISLEKTGTLEEYLKQADRYLDEKEIQKFAADLDAFAYGHDTYGYKDTIDNSDNPGMGAETISKDLLNGKIEPFRDWLQEIVEECELPEDIAAAKNLLVRLDKIAELQSVAVQTEQVAETQSEQAQEPLPTISFYVAECSEYPDMGKVYENLTLEEALAQFEKMPNGLYGPKSIGFDLKDGSSYDGKFDLLVGRELQKDIINGISHYRASTLVQQAVAGLERLLIEKGQMQESPEKTTVPIYRLTFMEASERGETEQWKANHWETKACATEFNENFGMAYHERRMPEFLQQMVDKYGMERCKIVLASTIQLAEHDGRYYPSTKEEAAKVFIPNVDTQDRMNDRRFDYRTDCHPVMVNSAFRELLTMEREQSQEKAVPVTEQDAKAPKESVLRRLHEKQKQIAAQKEKPAKVQDKKRGVEL